MSKSSGFGTGFGTAFSGFGSSLAISPISHVAEPLDLSTISDSVIQIIFKNLSRKDHENTKVKALEELSNIIEGPPEAEIEDGVLSTWMRIYPRLSVDSSRRVRQLAHILHATICSRNKKRVAKSMPQIIGPWLCGTYDNDRIVATAARESFVKTFSTSDKLRKVWEVYHSDILGYCTNIIEREQVYTLSGDVQGKNAEEAEAKFARVIGACISTIRYILMEVPAETISKEGSTYRDFLSKSTLWDFSHHVDPSVRSSVYSLLRACLKLHRGYLEPNLDLLAKAVITKSLTASQIGSVSDYLDSLIELTNFFPQIWDQVKGKKTNKTMALLGQFISQGPPQGAEPDFWTKMSRLFDLLPEEVIPQNRQSVEDFLDAYIHGINGSTVQRSHAVLSWTSYFSVCRSLLSLRALLVETKQMIIQSHIVPIYEEYLLQKRKFKFAVQGTDATIICVHGLLKLSPEKNVLLSESTNKGISESDMNVIFSSLWDRLEGVVFSRVKAEEDSSKISSELLQVGMRWIDLISELHKLSLDDGETSMKLAESNRKLIRVCLDILERHTGQSNTENITGVASLFEKALNILPPSIWRDTELHSATEDFFSVKLPGLHPSKMAPTIFKSMLQWLRFTDSMELIDALWTQNIQALLSSPEENKAETISAVFSDLPPELHGKIPSIPELVSYATGKARKAIVDEDEDAWRFTMAALRSQGTLLPASFPDHILELLTKRVSDLSEDLPALTKLDYMVEYHLHSVIYFVQNTAGGKMLLYHLLRLEGFAEEANRSLIESINQKIEKGVSMPDSREDAHLLAVNMAKIIAQAVPDYKQRDQDPIPLFFLASKALHIFHQANGEEKRTILEALMFSEKEWSISSESKLPLSRLLEIPPNPGVDLANPLSGCVYLIEYSEGAVSKDNDLVDSYAYHELLRMATYTFRLIQDPLLYEFLDQSTRVSLFLNLLVIVEMTKDNLHIIPIDTENISFVSDVQKFMAKRLETHHGFFTRTGHSEIDLLGQTLMQVSKGKSPLSFYGARVLYWLLSELVEVQGCSQTIAAGFIEGIAPRNSEDTFLVIAFLLALSRPLAGSKLIENLRNSVASDVSGISPTHIPKCKAPEKLILLNSLMQSSGDEEVALPTQRAMFLLRNTLTWFELDEELDNREKSSINEALVSATAKLLRSLVPVVKDVYGNHWKSLCRLVMMGWECSFRMSSMTYWCMKLYEALKNNHVGNDDFEEAFNDLTKEFHSALIQLFESVFGHTEDPSENICYTLLSRLIKQVPINEFISMDGVYPLLRGMPKPIHEAAYDILHQYIPMQQEQISIEAALAGEDDEFAPQLTPELLSLLLETPSVEKVEDLVLEGNGTGESTEDTLRGCFLAWRLIFDHFEMATFKVKASYTSSLQEGGYLEKLLDLTFDFLGITDGRPFEPSRDQITIFPIDEEDWTSPKSIKQLFVHLYYLSLLHSPSLVKNWFIELKNRQTSTLVETFTEKYISPLIIDSELTNVSQWASLELSTPTPGSSTDVEIQVKISRAVREVTIACPIDDQVMELLIRLPPAFPLRKPEIEGTKKVGFTDVQWKALKLSSHAVIALQGGSIVDAVMLFRKNVSLHFAGVEECAICYSIVGSERQVPNKSCVTCKNKFHAACLYKWFKTSNSSTCPLCRSGWQFYGRLAH